MPDVVYHGWTHRPKELGGTDPIGLVTGAHYEIVVVEADELLVAGDGLFYWPVPDDLNGYHLVKANAGVQSTSTSGDVEVMIRNADVDKTGTVDMLTDPITVQAGDLSSYETGGAAGVIDTGNDLVATGEWLSVDCDSAGTDTLGLVVILVFDSIPGGIGAVGPQGPQGVQGPPGSDGASAAEDVSVDDVADYYTGTDLESILAEIGASLGGGGGGGATASVVALAYSVSSGSFGGTATSGSWLTRPLNTIMEDDDSLSSAISSNQFVLDAGDYRVSGWASFVGTAQSKLRLRDITNSATLVVGEAGYVRTDPAAVAVPIAGRFTQASGATLELQYRTTGGRSTDGLGTAASFGEVEIYAYLRFELVA